MNQSSSRDHVAAYFASRSDAESAVRELKSRGFQNEQVTLAETGFERPANRITSDEYSPNSAVASAATHPESFAGKVKDFFSGETADSDINDNPLVDGPHVDITDRPYQPKSYVVTVRNADRTAEAQQILLRHHGRIDPDDGTGKTEYVKVPDA